RVDVRLPAVPARPRRRVVRRRGNRPGLVLRRPRAAVRVVRGGGVRARGQARPPRGTMGVGSMKAVIMAGGEGTRLRPLTPSQPTPVLTLGNRPLMEPIR